MSEDLGTEEVDNGVDQITCDTPTKERTVKALTALCQTIWEQKK